MTSGLLERPRSHLINISLHLMVFPVILGDGKPLWGSTTDKKLLQLTESGSAGDSVDVLIYEPADR